MPIEATGPEPTGARCQCEEKAILCVGSVEGHDYPHLDTGQLRWWTVRRIRSLVNNSEFVLNTDHS